MSYTGETGILPILWTGVIYVAYNLVVYPPSMLSLKRQKTRKECVVSGLIAGLLMTIPWFLTYFAMMSFYPDAEVLGAEIPWLIMIGKVGAPGFFSIIFDVVMGWTLIEKGYTALSYGFMLLYMLPIITVGVYKILKKDPILRTEKEPELVET